jgi:ABC-2 type transport system permease protein
MRCKEWRLLRRDPSLFAQIGLQIIYTVPVAVVLMRSDTIPTALALAPTIVVIAAQVAASLAWLTVSGEDAPELIATAPVVPGMVERAKLSAVALPVLVVMALPLAGLMLLSVKVAAVTFAFSAAAATATSLLNFWHPMPGNRRGMLRRHTQSKLVGLVEHVLAILFAVAVVFVFLGTWLWLAPCAIASAILALVRWRHLRGDAIGVVRARIVPAHPEPAVPGDSVRVNP